MRQGGTFDGAMGGDGDFEEFRAQMFLQAYVAALLANHGPTVSLQGPDPSPDGRVGQTRDLAHNSTSFTSAFSSATQSSSTGSR